MAGRAANGAWRDLRTLAALSEPESPPQVGQGHGAAHRRRPGTPRGWRRESRGPCFQPRQLPAAAGGALMTPARRVTEGVGALARWLGLTPGSLAAAQG